MTIILIILAIVIGIMAFGYAVKNVKGLEKFIDDLERKLDDEPFEESLPEIENSLDLEALGKEVVHERSRVVDVFISHLETQTIEISQRNFLKKHFVNSNEQELALALLNQKPEPSGLPRINIVDLALAIDDSDIVRNKVLEIKAAKPENFGIGMDTLWLLKNLNLETAIDEFCQVTPMLKPTEEQIFDAKENSMYYGGEIKLLENAACTLAMILCEQSFAMSFEAYKPGKYVDSEELIDFIFKNASDVGVAENYNELVDDEYIREKISWSVGDYKMSYKYNGQVRFIDVDWVLDISNESLQMLGSDYRCFRSDILEDSILLLVGEHANLSQLLDKYYL